MTSGIVCLPLVHREADDECVTAQALIVPKIAAVMPDRPFEPPFQSTLTESELADPTHHLPGEIHLLLGADVWAKIVKTDIKRTDVGGRTVVAQSTTFGYVIFGQVAKAFHVRLHSCHMSPEATDIQLDKMLVRFWNADAIPEARQWTPDEQRAEDIFRDTHRRDPSGRYVVRIPLRAYPPPLGNSKRAAKVCFMSVERKLQSNAELRGKYKAIFDDYRGEKHMVLAPAQPPADADSYYMPHHAINTSSHTPTKGKSRVVFNASGPSSNGVSYNDQQLAARNCRPI